MGESEVKDASTLIKDCLWNMNKPSMHLKVRLAYHVNCDSVPDHSMRHLSQHLFSYKREHSLVSAVRFVGYTHALGKT